ncbi:hypothetical protein [Streptomyces sp. NRRL S-1813]|uniref:hypothetical protein n=1 Tax=Streptomyces sp. NRRL S-1813 TaxID=1463888 RepID=UPI00131CAA45
MSKQGKGVAVDAPTAELPVVVIGDGPVGLAAAEWVEPAVPETGFSGGAGLFDEPDTTTPQEGAGCCAVPSTLQIGTGTPAARGGC